MRILVTGSRGWTNEGVLRDRLNEYFQMPWDVTGGSLVIVHGACPLGADMMAEKWAIECRSACWNVRNEPHPADWDFHGRKAGFIRNQEMADSGADVCLAFIRDYSRGATDCVIRARKRGIHTRVWREDRFGNFLGEERDES